LKETLYTKRIIHFSQTQDEGTCDTLFNDLAYELRNASGGQLSDIFSESIYNAEFPMHNYSLSQPARESLKQLWEESCTAADNLGTNGVKELEKNLLLFQKFCNENNESCNGTNNAAERNSYDSDKIQRQGKEN
jgi:hypothetical protein